MTGRLGSVLHSETKSSGALSGEVVQEGTDNILGDPSKVVKQPSIVAEESVIKNSDLDSQPPLQQALTVLPPLCKS